MDTDPATLAKQAAEQALTINDPAQRTRAITGILKAIEDANLVNVRKTDLHTLRETLSFRAIRDQTGMSLSRIEQIVNERTTGRRKKKASDAT